MMTESVLYKYAVNVKLSSISCDLPLSEVFPSVEDLVITSRSFDNFNDAVQSANQLLTNVTSMLNSAVGVKQYGMVSEINPQHSGQKTISHEWATNEIAKLWIIDELRTPEQKAKGMRAVGLGQLLRFSGDPILVN